MFEKNICVIHLKRVCRVFHLHSSSLQSIIQASPPKLIIFESTISECDGVGQLLIPITISHWQTDYERRHFRPLQQSWVHTLYAHIDRKIARTRTIRCFDCPLGLCASCINSNWCELMLVGMTRCDFMCPPSSCMVGFYITNKQLHAVSPRMTS